ncbi:MAG TPA: proline--tRNA ligase [Candidatus Acidoferrum sp.]|nr:proline--tRNA ligase [Candidatus Acidoferrum sp.]
MRWTQAFIPTLKETPAEAEITSHKLLLRAGLIRKLAGGLYTFLPLGLRALRKVERIVREEMDRAGGLEVLMPALQPPEIWRQSGRYETAAEVLFKVRDRAKKEWVMSPTAEEVITTVAASEINSYRQMPVNFYQVSVKFRDEIRPRFGLMRAKEFIMKDAYSFDVSDEAAMASYHKMYDAYKRIFDRCGLQNFPVEADTGVIGGNYSHEFMVPADTGENEVVYCEGCGYAANIEKATSGIPKTAARELGAAAETFPTPGVLTIEALSKAPYSVPANRQIKTLVFIADSKPLLVLIRGDDQLNETKLVARTGAVQVHPADVKNPADNVHFTSLGAMPGSLGAVANVPSDWQVLADDRLQGANEMTTGANEDGFHLRNVSIERDIKVTKWCDLRTVNAGEPCVKCGKPLKIRRAIEVGHVFKLGTKYSEKLNATFLAEDGSRKVSHMGCYGIGVTRTLQAIIEQSNDKDGIIWPRSVAPYLVCITPLGVVAESEVMKAAEQLYSELSAAGLEVIIDDRDERPGVKFKDADLVGFPIRVSVGEKSLMKGEIEIKLRGGELTSVPKTEAVARVLELARA